MLRNMLYSDHNENFNENRSGELILFSECNNNNYNNNLIDNLRDIRLLNLSKVLNDFCQINSNRLVSTQFNSSSLRNEFTSLSTMT